MGAAVSRWADLAIVTSDNPRSEDPAAIAAEIEAGIKTAGRQNYKIVLDRAQAIAEAIGRAGEGDVVLIAGKGHEDYQIHGSVRRAFRDQAVVSAELARLPA